MRRIETGLTALEADEAVAADNRAGLRRLDLLVSKLLPKAKVRENIHAK